MRAFWLLPAFWLGCSAHEAARPESAQLTLAVREVLAPCPPQAALAVPERDRVFVEMLILDVPSALTVGASLRNVTQLAMEPDVRLLGGPHLLADMEQRSSFTGVDVQGYSEQATLHAVSLTPHRADDGTVLDLSVTLQLPNPLRTAPNPTREIALSMASRADVPLVATAPWDEQRGRSLLIVLQGRSVRGQEDLRRIFECKMRRRAGSP